MESRQKRTESKDISFVRLSQVFRKALERTIRKLLTPEQILACYPKINAMESGTETLERARKLVQKYFHSTSLKQFEYVFSERDIEQKLNELDKIIQEATERKNSGNEEPLHIEEMSAEELLDAAARKKSETIHGLALIYSQLSLENEALDQELRELTEAGETLTTEVQQLADIFSSGINEEKRLELEKRLESLVKEAMQ